MSQHIAFDIQREIIKRLPVKSLIRFRSVCKAWKSFIDSSEFITGYIVPQNQPRHLLMKYEVGDRQETEFKCVSFVDDDTFPQQMFTHTTVPSLLEDLYSPRIIGSSHGVLCFYGFYHRKEGQLWPNAVTNMALLWNPSIRKSTAVVVPQVPHEVRSRFSSVVGFGVCPDTCDPMLVCITFANIWLNPKTIRYIPWQVLVFRLSSGVWLRLCEDLPRKSLGFTWSSTVIGRFIYWFAYDRTDENGVLRYRNLIMSFDMVGDEFVEIDLPDSLAHVPDDLEHMPEFAFSVSRLRESLVVLEYTKRTTKHQVCVVWMMMEHGDRKSFTKLFTIQAPDARIKRTLGFSRSGEAIIEHEGVLKGPLYYEATLAVYEPCKDHIKHLEIQATENSVSVNSYTESLLLLHEEDDLIYS